MDFYVVVLIILGGIALLFGSVQLSCYISKKKQERKDLAHTKKLVSEKEKTLNAERLSFVNTLAYWLARLEENTSENVSQIFKVKEPLFDEYKRLKCSIHVCDIIDTNGHQYFIRDRYILGGADYRQLFPFIGYDDIYYVIAISSYADKMTPFKDENIDQFYDDTFKVELLPYCQDKFVNSKVKPISYDPIYLPRMAFDSKTWRLNPIYDEVIFYDT